MLQVIESKYLRDLYRKHIEEYKELYMKAKELLKREGEDARWNNYYLVKDVINEFKQKSEMSYEEYVEQFLLTDGDVAKALFEYNDDSLVIYRIMEKTGCTYGDARNYHYGDFVKFLRKTYDKNMELKDEYGDTVIDTDMVENIKEIDMTLLRGYTIKHVIDNIILFHPDEVDEIVDYLNKRR